MKVGTDGVLLGAVAGYGIAHPTQILDIGTGCGLIALMLAQRFPDAMVTGVEIDADAAAEAAENFAGSDFADRLSVECCDALTLNYANRFDLIVCNPPFFNETLHAPDAARAAARHDDSMPLDALLRQSRMLLTGRGVLAMIYPSIRDGDVEFAATVAGLNPWQRLHVISKPGKSPIRTIWHMGQSDRKLIEDTLILRDSFGHPTDRYVGVVDQFYVDVK